MKNELRKNSKIKFKEKSRDIPSDYLDFRSEKACRNAFESMKNLIPH